MPEVAARAHLRWIIPVLDEAWADAGVAWTDVDAVAVTYGPGLAGSLLVGINLAKALAWVHDRPLVGVNHLEGHVYAAWLADASEPDAAEPVFPLVALVVSGGHTFLVEMTDHLTYRLLGTTVDDAAGEAFDKVGRLLGLGYPGGPAISRAAALATSRDRVFPRAWLGETLRLQLLGAQDRRSPDRGVGAGRRGAGRPAGRAAPRRGRRGARLGVRGCRRGRPRRPRPSARRGRAARARSCWAAGSRRTGPCADASPARPRPWAIPLIVPRPALCTDNGAMIGAAGARRFAAGDRSGLDLDARPSLKLATR